MQPRASSGRARGALQVPSIAADIDHTVVPFAETHKNLAAYLDRLMVRPSFARVLEEAQPYFNLFPLERKPTIARLGRVRSR